MHARYTQGPDELMFGHPDEMLFRRGEWREVDAGLREQLLLPGRVAQFGFEVSDVAPAADPAPAA
jgi:hypothetical protein